MSLDPYILGIGGLALNAMGAGLLALAVWVDIAQQSRVPADANRDRKILAARRLSIAVGGALLMIGFGLQIHGKRLERYVALPTMIAPAVAQAADFDRIAAHAP